jgi:penicillin-binding protein 1A
VADRYNPKAQQATKRFTPGDTLRVRIHHVAREGAILTLESGPQGAVMLLDPEQRQVLAMIGGYGYGRGLFNRALRARRQPGSSFKPFLYAAAFDSKKYTAASILNDSPQVYDLPDLKPWAPKNSSDHHTFMGPVRLRVALAHSLNTVASQLIYDLKPQRVIELAQALGITSKLEANYALALGASDVTLLELTNSYATLAARGLRGEPLFILQIGDEKPAEAELTQAVSPELSFVISNVMQSVIDDGTAVSIKGKLKRPVAGKTGTTNSNKDTWFVGYTPNLCAGVWVGFDDNRPLGEREQGARTALPIWFDVMQAALRDRPAVPFVQPAGVVVQRIDPTTGKRAAPGAPAIDEVFLAGTEPQEQALAPGETDPSTFNMDP